MIIDDQDLHSSAVWTVEDTGSGAGE
jgi:hypothetical protein